MAGYSSTAISNAAGAVAATITISGAANTPSSGSNTESRFLIAHWLSGGNSFQSQLVYILIPFLPIRAQPSDVLGVIGSNSSEFIESDVDLAGAAVLVQVAIGASTFMAALIAGNQNTIYVNNMIMYRAALEMTSGFRLKIAQMQKSDTAQFERAKIDFDALMKDLQDDYDRFKALLLGDDGTTNVPTLFTITPKRASPFVKVDVRSPIDLSVPPYSQPFPYA